MREFMRRLFNGRYGSQGTDDLTRFLLRLAIVFFALSVIFEPLSFLYYFAFIMLIFCYFRLFSKKIDKRTHENEQFKIFFRKLKRLFIREK